MAKKLALAVVSVAIAIVAFSANAAHAKRNGAGGAIKHADTVKPINTSVSSHGQGNHGASRSNHTAHKARGSNKQQHHASVAGKRSGCGGGGPINVGGGASPSSPVSSKINAASGGPQPRSGC